MKKYLLLGLTLLGTVGFAHEITGNGYDDTFDYPSYEPSEKVQKYANSAYEFYEEVGDN